ncbi:hypothetical protein ACFW04_005356 [Cataglyphis niger]
MAKLVNVWRDDEPVKLACKQLPLIIDESLTMIMDISKLGAVSDSPLIRGKQLDEFTRKLNLLTKEEIKASFEVTCKDMLAILGQAEPCVGCRRSVERLFYDLMKSGHPALDPLVITPNGLLSIKDDVLESPQRLCTILHGHSARLHNLVEKQPRNRKSRRCVLHSLEIQRMRPPPNAWKEVWDCMELPCQQELTLIETDTLDDTLETYLRKHRFCAECRNKVLLASSLLTREPEPTKEKGYVAVLYSGIKRCIADHHVHLPTITEYISTLIGRAQPELMGRERHAKTLEIAQEEVLTCLGICIAERLHRVHRRLKEEETVCKVLAAVAVDALSRNFQMAVEVKQGISQLELLYEEITREEIAKQQRREKLRLKRKKKKERRYETEEKENSCDEVEKIDKDQWHVYDKDCKDSMTNELLNAWITKPSKTTRYTVDKTRYTMWIEMTKRLEISKKKNHSSSEQSSQDCGYSSGHNISSSSLPSTPEGSEVACNDECCNHDGTCHDKLNHSSPSISLLQEGGLTLSQMLKDSNFSDDDEKESYIPAEEVLEFKSRMCQLTEKRQELRQTLRERFAMLCNHQKPLTIFH